VCSIIPAQMQTEQELVLEHWPIKYKLLAENVDYPKRYL
jgi:hypothetical protein